MHALRVERRWRPICWLVLREDGLVLLLTFEHESALNFYDNRYDAQAEVFSGVPAGLVKLVANQPENYEFLHVTDDITGNTLPHASGIFWFDGGSWHIASGLVSYCERNNVTLFAGNQLGHDVGFDYALSECLFGKDFSPETLQAEQIASGWYDEPDEATGALERVRVIFDEFAS